MTTMSYLKLDKRKLKFEAFASAAANGEDVLR